LGPDFSRSSHKNANSILPISIPIVVTAMKSDAIYAHYIQLGGTKKDPSRPTTGSGSGRVGESENVAAAWPKRRNDFGADFFKLHTAQSLSPGKRKAEVAWGRGKGVRSRRLA